MIKPRGIDARNVRLFHQELGRSFLMSGVPLTDLRIMRLDLLQAAPSLPLLGCQPGVKLLEVVMSRFKRVERVFRDPGQSGETAKVKVQA